MLDFLRQIVAAPLKVLLVVLRYVCIVHPRVIIKLIWLITRERDYAFAVLEDLFQTKGIDAAREYAENIFRRKPDGGIAGKIAFIELVNNKNIEGALYWINKAYESGVEKDEIIFSVKLCLSEFTDIYKTNEIADEILSHNDLPFALSDRALSFKMWHLVETGHEEEAFRLADRVDSIKFNPDACFIQWVRAMKNNNQKQADILYRKTFKLVGTHSRFPRVSAQAWLALGNEDQAMNCLYKAGYTAMDFKNDNCLYQLARSEKYHRYCEQMDSQNNIPEPSPEAKI